MKKSVAREYFESLVIAVLLALFVRTWVFQAFKIPTGSMEPNLLVGDHLIVNKMTFAPAGSAIERLILPGREIRRGDVVVFKYPQEPDRDFIKRVIGLPGDRLEVRRQEVFVNDQRLDDPWAHYTPVTDTDEPTGIRRDWGPVTIPADQYFMMGDNRDNSEDSRYWGFLPKSYVKGQALFIYFSFEQGEPISNLFGSIRWSRLADRVR